MAITITLQELQTNYANYLQAENPKISARNPNTYWAIQGGALSAILLDLYANLQLLENSIYPQNAVGDQVDLWLYREGLVARGGNTYGTISCILASTPPITITAGTVFTDSGNTVNTGNQYQALQDITVTNNTTPFTLYALQPGANYIEPIGNNLVNGTTTITVQSCTNGQNEESDQSCISRILMSVRIPKGGSRTTDYFEFALQANTTLPFPVITFALTILGFQQQNQISILGVAPLVGTLITEYQLNQGLLPSTAFVGYSRTADSTVITAVNNYIQSQRLVGLAVTVIPNNTYIVAGTNTSGFGSNPNQNLQINVALAEGYSLSTILNVNSQDQNNNPIVIQLTIEQLIQREARRAICNQPYGATFEAGQNQITANSITAVLNFQLSANNGQLAQILIDILVQTPNISVPNYNSFISSIYYTYDVESYNNIDISEL